MPGTQVTSEDVYGRENLQDPRNTVNADLRKIQPPAVQSYALRYHVRDEVTTSGGGS